MFANFLNHKSIGLLLVITTAACSPDDELTRTDQIRGKAVFDESCVQCHGADGGGAGPASLGLGITPPSLRQLSADNDGVFPREYVMATIDGLSRHNQLTAAMPEFGAGNLGPLIQVEENGLSTPIPADLLALANYIETIQY
jgi:mono/diheme cytochrome c family protein